MLSRAASEAPSSLPIDARRLLERACLRRRKLGLDLPHAEDRHLVADLTSREKALGTLFQKMLGEEKTVLEFTAQELGILKIKVGKTDKFSLSLFLLNIVLIYC